MKIFEALHMIVTYIKIANNQMKFGEFKLDSCVTLFKETFIIKNNITLNNIITKI